MRQSSSLKLTKQSNTKSLIWEKKMPKLLNSKNTSIRSRVWVRSLSVILRCRLKHRSLFRPMMRFRFRMARLWAMRRVCAKNSFNLTSFSSSLKSKMNRIIHKRKVKLSRRRFWLPQRSKAFLSQCSVSLVVMNLELLLSRLASTVSTVRSATMPTTSSTLWGKSAQSAARSTRRPFQFSFVDNEAK